MDSEAFQVPTTGQSLTDCNFFFENINSHHTFAPPNAIYMFILIKHDYLSALHQCSGTNVASPAYKDSVINCAEQIQLTRGKASIFVS